MESTKARAAEFAEARIGGRGPSLLDLAVAGLDPFHNVGRGALVQALVADAVRGTLTPPWHEYDVDAPGDVRLEVKSTATIQLWPAPRSGHTPMWELPTRRRFDVATGRYSARRARWADGYVLHLLVADACELDQWCDAARHQFYVVPTERIDALYPGRNARLSVGRVSAIVDPVSVDELRARVDALTRWTGADYA